MLQKVRKNIINKLVIKIILCLVIIAGTLIFTDMAPIKLVRGPEKIDIDNVKLDDYAGKYVEAKITYVYDYFLEEETYKEYKNGSRSEGKVTARYYITDVNLSQYLALLADGSDLMTKFEVAMDNTGIALDNNSEPTAFSYRGSFVKLSNAEYKELKSFMTQVGLAEDMYSDYIFKVNYVGKFDESYAIIGCGVIIMAVLFALLSLIRGLSGRYAKEVRKFAVDNEISFEQLCMELDAANEISNIWITSRYTAYIKGNKIRILKNEDYIWAYYKETRTTRRGVTTTTRQIALADRKKKFTLMTVASEEAARNILGIYSGMQPQMVIGFNEDLQKLFRENFDQFLLLPYQARSNEESAPSQEAAQSQEATQPQDAVQSQEAAQSQASAQSPADTQPQEAVQSQTDTQPQDYIPEEYVREGYVPEEYIPETYENSEQKTDNNNLF